VRRGHGGGWRMMWVAFALGRPLSVELGPSSRCWSAGELIRVSTPMSLVVGRRSGRGEPKCSPLVLLMVAVSVAAVLILCLSGRHSMELPAKALPGYGVVNLLRGVC
jgi:hypothetical protein